MSIKVSSNTVIDNTKNADFTGTLTTSGTSLLNGNVTIGNATTDDLSVLGRVSANIPIKTDSTYDLGATSLRFARSYSTNFFVGNDITLGSRTVSSPSISFQNYPNTGFYLSASKEISLTLNGVRHKILDGTRAFYDTIGSAAVTNVWPNTETKVSITFTAKSTGALIIAAISGNTASTAMSLYYQLTCNSVTTAVGASNIGTAATVNYCSGGLCLGVSGLTPGSSYTASLLVAKDRISTVNSQAEIIVHT